MENVNRGEKKLQHCRVEFNLARIYHGDVSSIPVVMSWKRVLSILHDDENITGILGAEIWVNYTTNSRLEEVAVQIVQYLETVKLKPNK